jgi:uncharacterized membrane protein
MESRAKVLGHAAHQMLIVFPLGLLVTACVFDAVHLINGPGGPWGTVAYWMIVAGLIGGLAAAVPGWIDWFAIPAGTRAKAVGLWHGVGNTVGVMGLYGASWWLRRDDPANPPPVAAVLAFVGLAVGGVTAWLGGELVDRLGIGVDPGAHPDSPNSLSGRPAHEHARGHAPHVRNPLTAPDHGS